MSKYSRWLYQRDLFVFLDGSATSEELQRPSPNDGERSAKRPIRGFDVVDPRDQFPRIRVRFAERRMLSRAEVERMHAALIRLAHREWLPEEYEPISTKLYAEAPGASMRRWARLFFSRRARREIFDSIIDDMRIEIFDALQSEDRAAARAARIRGGVAFVEAAMSYYGLPTLSRLLTSVARAFGANER